MVVSRVRLWKNKLNKLLKYHLQVLMLFARRKLLHLINNTLTSRFYFNSAVACLSSSSSISLCYNNHHKADYSKVALVTSHLAVGSNISLSTILKKLRYLVKQYLELAVKTVSLAYGYCALIWRALYLAVIFSPNVILAPLLLLRIGYINKLWWDMTRRSIRLSGPCLSKLAQWISTRPDLFSDEICSELKHLQSQKLGANYTLLKQIILKNFGPNFLSELSELEIIASGCVGQVYSARYRDQRIAIKIIQPSTKTAIEQDLAILQHLLQFLVDTFPSLDSFSLPESIAEFSKPLIDQIDLEKEAYNLERFIKNFDHKKNRVDGKHGNGQMNEAHRWDYVRVTRPLRPYVSPEVLVETYEEGDLMADLIHDPDRCPEKLKKTLAREGLQLFLKMVSDMAEEFCAKTNINCTQGLRMT